MCCEWNCITGSTLITDSSMPALLKPAVDLLHCSPSLLNAHPCFPTATLTHAHLHACRSCTLDPDSLNPLAHVATLTELNLNCCTGVTAAALEHLLSTSVQGCCLKISLRRCGAVLTQEACVYMHSRVLAQRGSRDTPALHVHGT
jgi:hypothetical protein